MGIFDFIFRRNKNTNKQIKPTKNEDKNNSIYDTDPIDTDPKERSKLFYEKHLRNIGDIDINAPKIEPELLSPEELSFLRYADRKQPVGIAGVR